MVANVISQVAQLSDSPLDNVGNNKLVKGQPYSSLTQALAQEMMKYMKGTKVADGQSDNVHSFGHFAGMIRNRSHLGKCCAMPNNCHGSGIVILVPLTT